MTSRQATVYGKGIKDCNYTAIKTVRVNGKKKILWICPFFNTWKHMLARCYCPGFQKSFKTYEGCEVSSDWLRLSVFTEWMKSQNWQGKQLDKDILIPGNKIYSEDTCVFVDQNLNSFLLSGGSNNTGRPQGSAWNGRKNKFQAVCRNPFTRKAEYLGYFDDPLDAHMAWRKRKRELAFQYADMQTDERIADALRKRF